MGKILNEANGYMFIIVLLGFIFFFIGTIKSMEHLCNHYGTRPDYKTVFTSKRCINDFIPLNCSLPVGDVTKCYENQHINLTGDV